MVFAALVLLRFVLLVLVPGAESYGYRGAGDDRGGNCDGGGHDSNQDASKSKE